MLFLKRFYLFNFRERGREEEREGEKHWCVRDTLITCLSHAPSRGPGPQPRHVPWWGIEPAAFHFAGWHSIHWATLTRAYILYVIYIYIIYIRYIYIIALYVIEICFHIHTHMHIWCVQEVSSNIVGKILTFIEEDIRYKKHCTLDNDSSVPFKIGPLGPHTVLPIAISCPIVCSWISKSEISSFSKVILVLGKAKSFRVPNQGCRGAESPGWFYVLPNNSAWDMMKLPITSCP